MTNEEKVTGLTVKKEMSIFKKIRKSLLIRNITREKFAKAPEYLQIDNDVIDAIISKDAAAIDTIGTSQIKRVLDLRPELAEKLSYENKIQLLQTSPELINIFSDNDKKNFLYSSKNFLESIKYLPEKEQIEMLTKSQSYEGNMPAFGSKGFTNEREGFPKQFGDKLQWFSLNAIKQAFDVLKQDDRYNLYNKERISLLSNLDVSNCDIEKQKEIAKIDVDYIMPRMSNEAAIEFVEYNPILISKLNFECMCKVVEEKPQYINCIPKDKVEEILKTHPEYISHISITDRLWKRLNLEITNGTENLEQIKQEMLGFKGMSNYYCELSKVIKDKEQLLELAKVSPKTLSPFNSNPDVGKLQNNIIDMYKDRVDDDIWKSLKVWQNEGYGIKQNYEFENVIKILSNQKVLETVPKEKIIEYINAQDMNKMTEMIGLAYGERAEKILRERPEISLQDIPNLYIFDEKIIDNFGVGTVHNMLSFDTKSAMMLSEFARYPEKLESFKKFSEISEGIYADSALGLEQKIQAFSNHFTLIDMIQQEELSEPRKKQLHLLLTNEMGNLENVSEIKIATPTNLEELDNYSANMEKAYDDCFEKVGNVDEVKELISRRFFGTKYAIEKESYSPNEYPLQAIVRYYNISKFITDDRTISSKNFSPDELDMLELSKIVSEVEDVDSLKEIYSKLSKVKGMEEVLSVKDIVKKVPLQYSKEMVDSLFTPEKARAMLENGDKGIDIKTVEGIDVISLQGADFKMLIHSMGLNNSGLNGIYGKDDAELWKNLECGISTISGSVIESEMLKSCDNPNGINIGFTNIPPEQIIGMGHTDIHVSHTKKDINPNFSYGKVSYNYSDELVRKTAAQISGVETKDVTHEYNEVTMNRFKTNIQENDGSGKIMPSYIVVYGKATSDKIEAAKKFGNIPIMEINTDVYTTNLSERAHKREEHYVERPETEFMHEIKQSIRDKDDDNVR